MSTTITLTPTPGAIPGTLAAVIKGETGLSAYEEAVEGGFVGNEAAWLLSLHWSSDAAQAATEAARDAALAAQAAAEGAQLDAETAANAAGLDALATAADRIVTAADRDAAAASALTAAGHEDQTTLDAIATAADRATVAADKAIVAGDKATTSGYKDAAAASATTATTQAGLATSNGAAQVALAAAQVALATTQANNAATSFDSFDDRYLGAKAVAPTLDNDGAALLTGALYWDTSLAALRVWTGAAWTNTTELDDRVLADQQLLGGVAYATDLAASAHRESAAVVARVVVVESGLAAYDLSIEQIIYAVTQALDLAGAAAKAQGAAMQVSAGTLAEPALWPTGDRNTGIYFPAADVVAWITAGLERARMDANGYLGLGTTTPTGVLDVNADKLRLRTAKTPASATAAGNAGEICWDASYLYVCTSTNVWRRTAHATW